MRTMLFLLAALLPGCSPPWEDPKLSFSTEPLDDLVLREWAVARAEGGDHHVTVRRAVRAFGGCERLEGHLVRSGPELTLRVAAPPSDDEPEAVCGYTATIRELGTGEYRLRVVHAGVDRQRAARTVMDHPIHIR